VRRSSRKMRRPTIATATDPNRAVSAGRVAGPGATSGALTRLPSDKLAEVLSGIETAIDAMGGSFTMHYTTVAVTSARTSAP
jgi:hypothetical protein